jgi:hypothetical protein
MGELIRIQKGGSCGRVADRARQKSRMPFFAPADFSFQISHPTASISNEGSTKRNRADRQAAGRLAYLVRRRLKLRICRYSSFIETNGIAKVGKETARGASAIRSTMAPPGDL